MNHQTLNKNMCLPPVGHTFVSPQPAEADSHGVGPASAGASYSVAVDSLAQATAATTDATEPSLVAVASNTMALPSTQETTAVVVEKSDTATTASPLEVKIHGSAGRKSAEAVGGEGGSAIEEVVPSPSFAPHPPSSANTSSLRRDLLRLSGLTETPHNNFTAASARRRGETISMLETLQEATSKGIPSSSFVAGGDDSGKTIAGKRKVAVAERWDGASTSASGNASSAAAVDPYKRSPTISSKDFVLDTFMRPNTTTRCKEFALEGLTSSEARTVSGMLRQASIEKIGSSHIGSIVSSASKSRMGNYSSIVEGARISTPESRLVVSIVDIYPREMSL